MDHRALDHALEARGGFGIVIAVHDEIVEFPIDVIDQVAFELFKINIAGPHYCGSVLILNQRKQ